MARETITLYADESALLVLTTRGRHPRKWVRMPLDRGLVRDGVILDQDAVAEKIRELWHQHKLASNRVIAGVSGINCLYRVLVLPELPKDLLPEALNREAGRTLGVSLEQLNLSWQTLPSSKGEMLVYLAASPRNSVDSVVSTLRKAGLNPYLLDLKPLALARTITEPRAIVIDLQPLSFDIVIVAEGIPQVARSLALADGSLPEERFAVIREELDRAITFYNSGHMDKPIQATVPLFVSGELASQEDAWRLLVGKQDRPVQALPAPIDTPEDFPWNEYATNIGLALKEVLSSEKGAIAYSQVNLNVLPQAYVPRRRPVSEIVFVPIILAGIALTAFAGYLNVGQAALVSELRADLTQVNETAVQEKVQSSDIARLRNKLSSIEDSTDQFLELVNRLRSGREAITGDLSEINTHLSRSLSILGVEHQGDSVDLSGVADSHDALFAYARQLRASGRFSSVVVTGVTEQEDEPGLEFSLTLVRTVEAATD